MNLVVAQRLVRRVCPACSAPTPPSEDATRLLRLPAGTELRRGTGCNACRQTGFAGRTGIYEVVPISQTIAKMIETSGGAETLVRQQARAEGARALLEDARDKMLAGVTTDSEVLRVVQVNEQGPSCPGCKQDIDDDYSVCPHCGTVLRALCAGCGKPLAAGWTACPYCGAKHEATVAAGAEQVASDAAPSGRRRSYKALVADDNAAIRDIVRLTLERSKLGLTVVTAENGKEALDVIALEHPDVLILDLQMPELDGFEVCKRLRSDVRTAFVPVLMLTAQTGEESVAKGFAAGTDDYMTKPFRRDDLIVRVRRMLERTYGTDALTGGPAEGAGGTGTAAEPVGPTASTAAEPLVEPRPGEPATPRQVADADVAGATGAVAAAQQHAIETLLAQLTADKEALSASVKRCEEQLAALGRRLDAETVQRSELTSQVSQTIEAQLADIRRTVAQIREEQQGAIDDLREKSSRTKASARAESAAKR
jgi:DNA-binding response OmpR family regulator